MTQASGGHQSGRLALKRAMQALCHNACIDDKVRPPWENGQLVQDGSVFSGHLKRLTG